MQTIRSDLQQLLASNNLSKHNQRYYMYASINGPQLSNILTQEDISYLHSLASSISMSAKMKEKRKLISELMHKRGLYQIGCGTNRVVYGSAYDQRFVLKIALDNVALKDNPNEFRNQFKLFPFCTKVFECTPCGTVALAERVQPMTKELFKQYSDFAFIVTYDFIMTRKEYIMPDIGSKRFLNWGIRYDAFGNFAQVVLIDYPIVYKYDKSKHSCRCGGELVFDDGFNEIYCSKCGSHYRASELALENYDDSDEYNKLFNIQEVKTMVKVAKYINGRFVYEAEDDFKEEEKFVSEKEEEKKEKKEHSSQVVIKKMTFDNSKYYTGKCKANMKQNVKSDNNNNKKEAVKKETSKKETTKKETAKKKEDEIIITNAADVKDEPYELFEADFENDIIICKNIFGESATIKLSSILTDDSICDKIIDNSGLDEANIELVKEKNDLNAKVNELTAQIEEINKKIAKLEEEKSAMEDDFNTQESAYEDRIASLSEEYNAIKEELDAKNNTVESSTDDEKFATVEINFVDGDDEFDASKYPGLMIHDMVTLSLKDELGIDEASDNKYVLGFVDENLDVICDGDGLPIVCGRVNGHSIDNLIVNLPKDSE